MDTIVPLEKLSQQDLVDELIQYLDLLRDDVSEDAVRSVFGLLLPVAADAGVFVEHDGDLYVFDMVKDHDSDGWEPTKYDLTHDEDLVEAIQVVSERLGEQIRNASKGQLVHYTRWSMNMMSRT